MNAPPAHTTGGFSVAALKQGLAEALGPRVWPGLLAVVGVLFLFRDTVTEMLATYDRSGTFAHGYLVPPIVVWLIWRLRHVVAPLPVKPMPWVLTAMLVASAAWLAGELAVVNAASQLALVTVLVLIVPVVYGFAVTRALLFPLAFLYFAAPVGEFLQPVMMEATADFAVMALRWTGIPVYREGLQFVIPSGNWSVIEACSGVRYLIASFMVGTLFAYLNYSSAKRRWLFVLVSLLVPIVANWLRAYMIVMLGHLSGNTLAVGVDHLIYGWVFFGIVIGLMFMIGARWAQPNLVLERAPGAAPGAGIVPSAGQPVLHTTAAASMRPLWLSAASLLVLLLAVHSVLWQLDEPRADPLGVLQLPAASPGWQLRAQEQERPFSGWVPAYSGARSVDKKAYVPDAAVAQPSAAADAAVAVAVAAAAPGKVSVSRPVGVWVGYYREQGRRNKMVTSSNTLTQVEKTQWAQVSRSSRSVQVGGRTLPMRATTLRGPGEPGSASAQRLLVWQSYWINGHWVASDARAKLTLALNRVMGRGDDAAAIMFYTPLLETNVDMAQAVATAEAALQSLVASQLPQLEARLQALAKKQP